MERLGRWLFRYRGLTPAPLVALFVVAAQPSWPALATGLPLVIAGELLRVWSVAFAGLGTRGRSIGAEELVAWGPYAKVRNPIYVANFLLCVGFGAMAGLAQASWRGAAALAFVLLFALQYAAIVAAEERWLMQRFGAAFEAYRVRVPRWLPRLRAASAPPSRGPRWREALRSERDTALALLAVCAYLVIRVYV